MSTQESITSDEVNKLNSVDFNIGWTPDQGDDAPPPVKEMLGNLDENSSPTGKAPIEYDKALAGFWGFVDLGMQMVAKMSKGTIEYDKMDQPTINALAVQSAQSEHFQKLAVMEGAPTWLVIANATGQFATRIKVKPKKKEEKKKSEISKEDLLFLKNLAKKSDNIEEKSEIQLTTQGDLSKMLESDNMEESDKKVLKQLIENGEATPETLTNSRIFSKSRSQLIKEEEDKVRENSQGKIGVKN